MEDQKDHQLISTLTIVSVLVKTIVIGATVVPILYFVVSLLINVFAWEIYNELFGFETFISTFINWFVSSIVSSITAVPTLIIMVLIRSLLKKQFNLEMQAFTLMIVQALCGFLTFSFVLFNYPNYSSSILVYLVSFIITGLILWLREIKLYKANY